MSKDMVVHCKRAKYDVYIGRPSMWGNPFPITSTSNREEVIQDYKEWLEGKEFTGYRQDQRTFVLEFISTLKGKVLGCWCRPKRCHGDVLVELANNL